MKPATILDPARARAYEAAGHWPGRTLCDAVEEVRTRTPHKVAVVAGERRVTYDELASRSAVIAENLRRLGIGPGDVVSLQLPNGVEFVLAHLALTSLGAITNALLPVYRARELVHILAVTRARAAVIPASFRGFDYPALYTELRDRLPCLEHVFVVGDGGPADMHPFAELAAPRGDVPPLDARRFDGNDVTSVIFTSGTESTPKGVMHSHNTLMYGNVAAARLLGLTADEVVWAASPITHATGFEWNLRQALVLGGTVVMQEHWDPEAGLALIERERCTLTTGATPFASLLLEAESVDRRDLRSFRTFLCGGAPIPPKLGAEMKRRVGCSLIGVWGMSECFVASSSTPSDSDERKWNSDGSAMPGTELAIFDEARARSLPPGEVGEIATRGPHVCLGYFEDPERTRDTFSAEGWLFSGDLGVMDADGYLRVVGRKKDVINRGGLKISSREVEDLLSTHPSVAQASVVGVPDARLGERSCAFVVPRSGARVTLKELVAHLRGQGIANYKLPEDLVLLDALPMTATGKVQKFVLRERFAELAQDGQAPRDGNRG